jgi:misacylated tRNA(Ala) deacylase
MTVETTIVDARPDRVLLAVSPFFPGGGGHLADRGTIRWHGREAHVDGFEAENGTLWHLLADAAEPSGSVEAVVDPDSRQLMRELHTDTYLLNAFVFRAFDVAPVTGAQMNLDGTARMDFDLPDADNDRLRALDAPINDAIRQDLTVATDYVAFELAQQEPGLIRNRSVAPPPTADGMVRIVDIIDLDRQGCGGTHLAYTWASRPVRILRSTTGVATTARVYIGPAGTAP